MEKLLSPPRVKLLIQEMNRERMETMLLRMNWMSALPLTAVSGYCRSSAADGNPRALVVSRSHPSGQRRAPGRSARRCQPLILLSSGLPPRGDGSIVIAVVIGSNLTCGWRPALSAPFMSVIRRTPCDTAAGGDRRAV